MSQSKRIAMYASDFKGLFPTYSNAVHYSWHRVLSRCYDSIPVSFRQRKDFASISCPDPRLEYNTSNECQNIYGVIYVYRLNFDTWVQPYYRSTKYENQYSVVFHVISKIANPTQKILMGDSGPSNTLQESYFYNARGGGANSGSFLRMRHKNSANCTFIDGHVQSVFPGDCQSKKYNVRSFAYQNGVLYDSY